MKIKIKKYYIIIIGITIGVFGGLLYYKFVGCASGTCPITSNWAMMSVYGGLVGGLLGSSIQEKLNKKIEN